MLWFIGFLLTFQAKFYVPDSAVDMLIKFLHAFFRIIYKLTGSELMEMFMKKFPPSLHMLRKDVNVDSFTRFVVCSKCCEIYKYKECISTVGPHKLSKDCCKIHYPNHLQPSRRLPCGNLLYISGKKFLYPFKIYGYKSLNQSLQSSSCQEWRSQSRSPSNSLQDIYDGKIWKDYQQYLGSPFLSLPFSFAFVLNIDWFQPYTHTNYSVGVIYLTVLNLPRALRYKRENVILIGIIPGPNEPKDNINSFLKPLVIELLQLWNGVKMQVQTTTDRTEQIIRCAILCVSCDIPAGRKTCGFLGHAANLGCSKCLKEFPGGVGNKIYSGFNRNQWKRRTNKQHRDAINKIQKCKTKTTQKEMESLLGCRYSCLLDLPYFDAPRMLCIDPMHNLFLGSGKHMLSVWIKNNWISKKHFETIQHFVDSINIPSDIGRIPSKISSGFSGFKADQFKAWITVYSIPALFNILPGEHLECWRHFVLACRILCKQCLSYDDVNLADALLLSFCKRVEHIYGQATITPNMHLHAHLKDVFLDFGPAQEFWLFSFERYNGLLGKQPTNNRVIEPQLMNRFIKDNQAFSFSFPQSFKEELSSFLTHNQFVGSVSETFTSNKFALPSKWTRAVFDTNSLDVLKKLYCKIHQHVNTDSVIVNSTFKKYSSITFRGKTFSSSGKRKGTPYVLMANWKESTYGTPPTPLANSLLESSSNTRPIDAHYYVEASFLVNEEISSLFLAHVSWMYPHSERYTIGKPVELWCRRKYEAFGIHSFVPLDSILCRCAHGMIVHNEENLCVAIPLVE